jgi:hypothetical protein
MAYKTKDSPLKQGWAGSIMGSMSNAVGAKNARQPQKQNTLLGGAFGAIKGNNSGDWKSNYWENKRKADFTRGKAETQAELVRRQKPVVTGNASDRAGAPIAPDPNAIVQPPQPNAPVDITPKIAVKNNSDYNLRNMEQTQQTPINPKAFSNQGAIQGVNGQAIQGTFNRSVGSPLGQVADISLPQPPPEGIETPISPTYDLSNQ